MLHVYSNLICATIMMLTGVISGPGWNVKYDGFKIITKKCLWKPLYMPNCTDYRVIASAITGFVCLLGRSVACRHVWPFLNGIDTYFFTKSCEQLFIHIFISIVLCLSTLLCFMVMPHFCLERIYRQTHFYSNHLYSKFHDKASVDMHEPLY